MPTRRQFLRDCSVAATVASLAPAAALAQKPGGRKAASSPLVFEHFAEELNTTFNFRSGPQHPGLRLVEAARMPAAAANAEDARNERFCLLFRGPARQALEQDTYTFQHPRLGSLAMFIVPTVSLADPAHCYYEAVFNYPIQAADLVAQLSRAPQPVRRG